MKLMEELSNFEDKNRPAILTGLGLSGVWITSWLSYKAGQKSAETKEKVEKAKSEHDAVTLSDKLDQAWEIAKIKLPTMLPSFVFGSLTSLCVLGSYQEHRLRLATMSAAYSFASTALREGKEKATEILGEKKVQQIQESISKDHVTQAGVPNEDRILYTGMGNTLCYDEYTDRYFYASPEAIGQAINKVSYQAQTEMWASLNDFYYELNLKPCKMGDDLGWPADYLIRGQIPVHYTAVLTEDNRPCLAVQFDVAVREKLY